MSFLSRLLLILSLILIPASHALGMAAYEIEVSDVRKTRPLVKKNGNIIKAVRSDLSKETGVNGNTVKWASFKSSLRGSQVKGIAGEVATKFFFAELGYKPLEEHYVARLKALLERTRDTRMKTDATCTTKKGPDNGIDGIFILNDEKFGSATHFIVNESKFRNKRSLSSKDFGFIRGQIQQGHSRWNASRWIWADCLTTLPYGDQVIIRTATLLDRDGNVKLYELRDKGARGSTVGEYASDAPKRWSVRKKFDTHLTPQLR